MRIITPLKLRCLLSGVAAMLLLGFNAGAQNITVSGVVSDPGGEPLIGAGVLVKGTTQGTTTGLDGDYTITVTSGQTLVFTSIGFLDQEITVDNQTVINVTLELDQLQLDEVVVVGYGVQKKKLVTGSTVQVKGDDVAKKNTTNPLQAMQGQAPGVSISSTSGQPGSDMKVTIRGLGTVGNSGPLYLIDGVGGDISTLNPADIESIDVLKDAASAAIYGAQAANGVILITTKSGKEGRSQVTFDAYYGIQNVARTTQMLNAQQYMTIMDEQALNSGDAVYNWDSYSAIHDASGKIYDTDWVKQMFKDNARTQSYAVSLSGGSSVSTYALSLGYMDQEGIAGGKDVSFYERYNGRLNAEQKLFGNLLKIGEQISFVYKKNNGISVGNQYNNSLRGAFGNTPLHPVYGQNSYDVPYYDTSNSDWYDGIGNTYGSMMVNNNNLNKNATLSSNLYAEVQPLDKLKFRTVFGLVYGSSEYRYFKPLYKFSVYDYNEVRTSVSQNMNTSLGMTWTNTLQYDFEFGDHAFNALLGMEAYRYSGMYVGGSQGGLKEGFDSWDYAYINNGTSASSADGLGASGAPHDDSRSVSYFTRLGWNYKERYMINATLRVDGSSRFARGHRYGVFPSVSAGWTITNEDFMQNATSWLNFLKLRVSWGQVGNQNISNYQYLAPIKNTNTHYLFGTSGYDDATAASALANNWGAYPSRLANEKVKWETSEQTNLGLDARLWGGKLAATFDYYIKNTKDWLVVAPILKTVGAGAPYINGGSVRNTGVEVSLTWNDMIGKDFGYTIGVNGAYNKNVVGEIPTEDGIIHGSTGQLYDNAGEFYRAENGHAIGYFWGYKTAGIFQNQDEIQKWIASGNGILQSDVQPGDVKYIDVNHDGVIDDLDKVDLGNGMPKVTLGFNIGFDWKGLDFSMNASGAIGNKIVQSYRNHTNTKANYTAAILDRWTGEGTSDKMPRVTNTNINWQFSDLYIHDGSYLRISTVTLGYDFASIMNLKFISQARLYLQAQNLFTFTKYNGMDPEIGYGTDGWVSGIDVGYYPRPRTLLVGVNLKF